MNRKIKLLITLTFLCQCIANAQWTNIELSEEPISDIYFVDEFTGYIGGVDGIYKTSDGGVNWNLLPYFQNGSGISDSIHYIAMNQHYLGFATQNIGYSVGWNALTNGEIIIKTSDAGSSWGIQHNVNPNNDPFQSIQRTLRDISVIDINNVVAVGYMGRILSTKDGGVNWEVYQLDDEIDLETVQFLDTNVGFAAGGSTFLRTTNGGNSWIEINTEFHINDLHFVDQNIGFGVTSSGVILKTMDAGESWSESNYRSSSSLRKIQFLSSQMGYVVGSNEILKTEDGGNTWQIVNRNEGESEYTCLFFTDVSVGYIGTWEGSLLKTEVGGNLDAIEPVIDNISDTTTFSREWLSIYGSNLMNVTAIEFNGDMTDYKILDDTEISFKIPSGATTGALKLHWRNGIVTYNKEIEIGHNPYVDSYPSGTYFDRGYSYEFTGEDLDSIAYVKCSWLRLDFTLINKNKIRVTFPEEILDGAKAVAFYDKYDRKINNHSSIIIVGNPSIDKTKSKVNGFPLGLDYEAGKNQEVEMTGYNLIHTNRIWLGNIEVDFQVIDNEHLTFITPVNADTDFIKIETNTGTETSPIKLTIYDTPEITYFINNKSSHGDTIIIVGENFIPNRKHHIRINGDLEAIGATVVESSEVMKFLYTDQIGGQLSVDNVGGTALASEEIVHSNDKQLYISSIHPEILAEGRFIKIRGWFPNMDSITFAGTTVTKSMFIDYRNGFWVPNNLHSSVLKFYKRDEVVLVSDSLLYQDNPSPYIVSFSPNEATAGTYVNVEGYDLKKIDSVFINGKKALFTIIDNEELVFTVPAGSSSGPIQVCSEFGIFESESNILIKPISLIPPEIDYIRSAEIGYRSGIGNNNTGARIAVVGSNFSQVDSITIDGIIAPQFNIVTNSSIELTIPYIINQSNDVKLVIYSKAGIAYSDLNLAKSYIDPNITDIFPLEGNYGSSIDVKFSSSQDLDVRISNFYINNVKCESIEAEDQYDNRYLIVVPDSGMVSGNISYEYNSRRIDSEYSFNLIEEEYCVIENYDNRIGEPHIPDWGISNVNFGSINNTPDDIYNRYLDFSDLSTNVYSGHSYPMQISTKISSQIGIGLSVKVYVDWNADKYFNEDDEVIFENKKMGFGGSVLDNLGKKIIQIPDNIAVGNSVKMRVLLGGRVGEGYLSDVRPCGISGAIVQDYTLNLVAHTENNNLYNFYPKDAKEGADIFVNGDSFENLDGITLNGLEVEYEVESDNFLKLKVPTGATDGYFKFDFTNESIISTEELDVQSGLTYPEIIEYDNYSVNYSIDFEYSGSASSEIYDVRINDKPVSFKADPNWNRLYYYPDANTETGTLCVYGRGGSFCTNDTLKYPPIVYLPDPKFGVIGQTITLPIYPSKTINKISLGDIPVTFELQNKEERVTFEIPQGSVTSKIYAENKNGIGSSIIDFTVITDYCVPETDGILAVDRFTFSSLELKNLSSGYSDFTDSVVHVFPNLYYRSNLELMDNYGYLSHKIYVDWNLDFDFDDDLESSTRVPYWAKEDTIFRARVIIDLPIDSWESYDRCKAVQVIDFSIRILPVNSENGSIARIINPKFDWVANCGELSAFFYDKSEYYDDYIHNWDFGDNSSAQGRSVHHQFSQTGEYEVKLTISSAEESVTISKTVSVANVANKPTINSENLVSLCEGEETTLSTVENYKFYKWSNGESTNNVIIDYSSEVNVKVSNDGKCWSESSENIEVNLAVVPDQIIVEITGNINICEGDSIRLTAPYGYNYYDWSSGETSRSIYVNETARLEVRITDNERCWSEYSDPINTTLYGKPVKPDLSIDGNEDICQGESVTLNVASSHTYYEWNNGDVTPIIEVFESGNFYVRTADLENCWSENSDTKNISVIAPPDQPIIKYSEEDKICFDDSVSLDTEGDYNYYEWNNEDNGTEIIVHNTGDYSVRVAVLENCWSSYSDSIDVEFYDEIFVNITLIEDSLRASEGVDYEWYIDNQLVSRGQQSIPLQVSGEYYVKVFDQNRCFGQSEIFEVDWITGLTKISNKKLNIYPNPVKGEYLNIEGQDTDVSYSIYNMTGKQLDAGLVINSRIDVNRLESGTYTLKLSSDSNVVSFRFIKF